MIIFWCLPAGHAYKVGKVFNEMFWSSDDDNRGIIHESLAMIQIRLWVQVIKNVSHCGSSKKEKYTFLLNCFDNGMALWRLTVIKC